MPLTTVKLVYFSPTETTKKVLESIANGIQANKIEHLDLTRKSKLKETDNAAEKELAIIGVPVYGGRVPLVAIERLKQLKAEHTPAVLVVVYGNREYEDALVELRDLVSENGFIPIAGAAFIGEHSFSTEETPIADGRPDEIDLEKAESFGKDINSVLEQFYQNNNTSTLNIPGNHPYRERSPKLAISPTTNEELCTKCEICFNVCPTFAISINSTIMTNQESCIVCCACVKNCPSGAREIVHPRMDQITEWLQSNCSQRKEPEIYM